jgi:hypothetical protein
VLMVVPVHTVKHMEGSRDIAAPLENSAVTAIMDLLT